jgi:Platelet-activating factor acetylhydrolase, isoform II
MNIGIIGTAGSSLAVRAILTGALACVSTTTMSAPADEGERGAPGGPGPYGIGHTTLVVTDASRNLDGSTPSTGSGRPLYVHIWYPTNAHTNQHVRYSWNNPVYNQNPGGAVYPGLPDLPALTFAGSTSLHPVAEQAPLARDTFPLLVASHGNETAATKVAPDTLEALASHGYVVASVEHTGDDDAWYQAYFLESYVGLALGPNTSIFGPKLIYQRSQDVRFVIDAVLNGVIDRQTGMNFSRHVDADEIGVLGHSLGGQTSLATVTGISSQGLPPDARVKAAFMIEGTNYGLLLNAADYANARVPLLFFGNDMGIAYDNFNAFTHSRPKYLVDVSGISHHTGGYQSSWCQDIHNSLSAVNPAVFPQAFIDPSVLNPADIANYVFDATFYFSYTGARESGIYDYCDASVFDGISDAQLVASLFGNAAILAVRDELKPLMPMRPEVSIAETTRLTNLYALSFFDQALKHDSGAMRYLTDSGANQRANPLVDFVADCEKVRPHPIDLRSGDEITFTPMGGAGYNVEVATRATLLDPGTTKLAVGGGGSRYLSYPGFSFTVPGVADPISTLIVNEDGAITARTSSDIGKIDDNGSPWYSRGQLLLSGRFTIGALMKNLDSTAAASGGGVFGYFDAPNHRVVVSYLGVPAIGTTQPNTLQVVIYDSGKIEMIVGGLAATGANFSPGILGTLGIAAGHTKAGDLRRMQPVNFSAMRGAGPTFIPFGADGAIYEQFYTGKGASCRDQ